jgi:hypothetical protein
MSAADTLQLAFVPDCPRVRLKELTGADEQMIDACDTLAAIRLLDRLISEVSGPVPLPGKAASLPSADRDRLLCAIYRNTYGSRISGTVACASCGKAFDLDFDLIKLQAALQPAGVAYPKFANDQMAFVMADGRSFRLPTGEDELAVWHLPADKALAELLQRCVLEGDPHLAPQSVQAVMEAVAPLLDVELTGHCPECGHYQAIHFDIQSFLLSALQAEKPRLMREVHRLATAYGWPLGEILNLSRSQRRAYVKLIEDEANRYPDKG